MPLSEKKEGKKQNLEAPTLAATFLLDFLMLFIQSSPAVAHRFCLFPSSTASDCCWGDLFVNGQTWCSVNQGPEPNREQKQI